MPENKPFTLPLCRYDQATRPPNQNATDQGGFHAFSQSARTEFEFRFCAHTLISAEFPPI